MEDHCGEDRSRRRLPCAPTGEESEHATTGRLTRPNVAAKFPVNLQIDRQPGG